MHTTQNFDESRILQLAWGRHTLNGERFPPSHADTFDPFHHFVSPESIHFFHPTCLSTSSRSEPAIKLGGKALTGTLLSRFLTTARFGSLPGAVSYSSRSPPREWPSSWASAVRET